MAIVLGVVAILVGFVRVQASESHIQAGYTETETFDGATHASANPAHMWVQVKAANSGTVSSGGRFHDCADLSNPADGIDDICSAAHGGDWSIDIAATGTTYLAIDYGGHGFGGTYVDHNYDITLIGKITGEGNWQAGRAACFWKEITILATWRGVDNVQHTQLPIGWVLLGHQSNWVYSGIGAIIPAGVHHQLPPTVGPGWVHTVNVPFSTVYPGPDTGDDQGRNKCSSGAHTHQEFRSNHGIGKAYEWHGSGPEAFDVPGVGVRHVHGNRGAQGFYVGGADSISVADTVALLGGDYDPAVLRVDENPCYTRRPPHAPLHQSASVSETTATIFFADTSCDETSFQLLRQTPGGWVPAGAPQAGDKYQWVRAAGEGGLSPGTYYGYWATASNVYGTTYAGSFITAITLGAPIAPQPVGGYSNSPYVAHLDWSDRSSPFDVTGSEAGFMVTRFDGSLWVPIASLPANTTSFDDLWVTPGTQYAYWIYAYRGLNSEGANPNGPDPQEGWAPALIAVDVLPSQPDPQAPTVVGTWSTQSSTTIMINNFLGAEIRRYNKVTQGADIAGYIPYGSNVFTDYNRRPGEDYAYWVVSNNQYTSLRWVRVNTLKANAPRPVYAAGVSQSAIILGWLDQSVDEAGFNVRRYYLPLDYWELLLPMGPDIVGFGDGDIPPGTPKAYWLTARSVQSGAVVETYAPMQIAASTFPP